MNVRINLVPIERSDIEAERVEYLDQLSEAQDAFVEVRLLDAQFYLIEAKQGRLGYCAISPERTLLEFYLRNEAVWLAQSVFPKLIEQLNVRAALIKSFDALFLSCALDLNREVESVGMLVRTYTPQALPELARVRYSYRVASEIDLPRIFEVRQDVFTHPKRLAAVVRQQQLLVFEHDEHLIGFGILRPVVEGRDDVEVGIAVDEPYRNKGYAAFILRDLVEYCLAQGKNPVSGCSMDNLASIRLGQRIGLCAPYRLVRVTF